jgi:hypothetical protein
MLTRTILLYVANVLYFKTGTSGFAGAQASDTPSAPRALPYQPASPTGDFVELSDAECAEGATGSLATG